MSSFVGSLRISATDDVVEAVFDVSEQDLVVSTGGERLGSWSLSDVDLDDTGTEIYLSLGGEEVIVNMPQRDAFVTEIHPPKKQRARHVKARHEKPQKPGREPRDIVGAATRLFQRETWQTWLSDRLVRWVIASVSVMIVALLALFATSSLGMILVLLGMVALVIAALAVSEDLNAVSWVPADISETALVVIGAVAMVIGALLITFG